MTRASCLHGTPYRLLTTAAFFATNRNGSLPRPSAYQPSSLRSRVGGISQGRGRFALSGLFYHHSVACGFEERFDETLRDRAGESVTISAQFSHAIGRPCSQRECAGLSGPPLSIRAEEPISISPVAVNRAGCGFFRSCCTCSFSGLLFRSIVASLAAPLFQSRVVGDSHDARYSRDA